MIVELEITVGITSSIRVTYATILACSDTLVNPECRATPLGGNLSLSKLL